MKTEVLSLFAALLTTSCVWNSSVTRLPNDAMQVSATASPSRGGETEVRDMASNLAEEHCGSLEKQSQVLDIETRKSWPKNIVATVTFTCE